MNVEQMRDTYFIMCKHILSKLKIQANHFYNWIVQN